MDDRTALDLATERALQELGANASAGASSTELEAAKQKAFAAAQSGDLAEARNAIQTSRERASAAAGLIVPRIILGDLIDRGRASNGKKKTLRRRLAEALRQAGGDEAGCLEIPLRPSKKTAYVALGKCVEGYDLGAELAKITLGAPAGDGAYQISEADLRREDPMRRVRESLGTLIQCGQHAYASFLLQHAGLVADILQTSGLRVDPRALRVGHEDTTLYLDVTFVRVGIHTTVSEVAEPSAE